MFERNRDLTKVFDDRWKANHNYDNVKKAQDRDRDFQNRMFGVSSSNTSNNTRVKSSMEIQLERLNKNMSGLRKNNFR